MYAVEQVPVDDFELPLGQAETLFKGSDLTLLTWGTPVYQCETAIHLFNSPPPELQAIVPDPLRSAKIELIDLRSILPWDVETVVESVQRTGRLVIVHEAGMTAGVGAEIAAEVQKRCFLRLNAPVKRVGGWECVLFIIIYVLILTFILPLACQPHYNMRSFIFPILFGFWTLW